MTTLCGGATDSDNDSGVTAGPPPGVAPLDAGPGGVAVRVAGARKTYPTPGGVDIEALAGVDLDVPASSVTAVVGPSGSGKSTLLHLIGGMDRPDSGTITCGDIDITSLTRSDLVGYRRTVGFVFQSFALLPALTNRDNVMLPTIPYRDHTDTRARAGQLLAEVGRRTPRHRLTSPAGRLRDRPLKSCDWATLRQHKVRR